MPVPTHDSSSRPTRTSSAPVQVTNSHQGRHAHRHRAPLQCRLRRDRPRQSEGRSVAAGRRQGDRRPVAVHPAERAARRHRDQYRRDAAVLLPEAQEGRAAGRHTHPIGIGKVGWATPEGVTKIVRRQKDPTWRPPASSSRSTGRTARSCDRVIGPGPDNPLGRHAFYLGWPSYMIHGTNKPAGVGLRSSHGCIRLYPEDIAQLFDMVPSAPRCAW